MSACVAVVAWLAVCRRGSRARSIDAHTVWRARVGTRGRVGHSGTPGSCDARIIRAGVAIVARYGGSGLAHSSAARIVTCAGITIVARCAVVGVNTHSVIVANVGGAGIAIITITAVGSRIHATWITWIATIVGFGGGAARNHDVGTLARRARIIGARIAVCAIERGAFARSGVTRCVFDAGCTRVARRPVCGVDVNATQVRQAHVLGARVVIIARGGFAATLAVQANIVDCARIPVGTRLIGLAGTARFRITDRIARAFQKGVLAGRGLRLLDAQVAGAGVGVVTIDGHSAHAAAVRALFLAIAQEAIVAVRGAGARSTRRRPFPGEFWGRIGLRLPSSHIGLRRHAASAQEQQ